MKMGSKRMGKKKEEWERKQEGEREQEGKGKIKGKGKGKIKGNSKWERKRWLLSKRIWKKEWNRQRKNI